MSTELHQDPILRTLRAQAWERAKGELKAMLHTFYTGRTTEGTFAELQDAVDRLINTVEYNSLHE